MRLTVRKLFSEYMVYIANRVRVKNRRVELRSFVNVIRQYYITDILIVSKDRLTQAKIKNTAKPRKHSHCDVCT